jgi:hypothetical protein
MRGGEEIERGGHGGGWTKKMTKGILLSIQNYVSLQLGLGSRETYKVVNFRYQYNYNGISHNR